MNIYFCRRRWHRLLLAVLVFSGAHAHAAETALPNFEPETVASIGKGYGLSIADVDGDGKPDILLADVSDFVWYRNGDWKRFVLANRLDGQGAMSIDARDVTGDGKVEIAVCTRGPEAAVYFLKRPEDPTQLWTPVRIPSEPEQHRIQWARDYTGTDYLIAVPNLGRRNHLRLRDLPKDDFAKIYAYPFTLEPEQEYAGKLLLESMRDMHSLAVIPGKPGGPERLLFVGMEGVELMNEKADQPWQARGARMLPGMTPPNQRPDQSWHAGLSEISEGHTAERMYLATIEPKHGNNLIVYPANAEGELGGQRVVVDDTLVTAHAMRCVDILGLGQHQILVGWWGSGVENKDYGIRLYIPQNEQATEWKTVSIDDGKMACQSLQVADLDGDGRLDIIAAGWSTNNLTIYWNRQP